LFFHIDTAVPCRQSDCFQDHPESHTMPARNESARQSRRRSSSQPDETRPARTARSLITFVDSQDPNSRSAIQRHTAFHSNAQRRDARLQSLRNTSRPRLLEWQRRSDSEGLPIVTSQTSSTSSSSISLIPTPDVRRVSQRPSPEVSDFQESTPTTSERDHLHGPLQASEQEAMITYRKSNLKANRHREADQNHSLKCALSSYRES
jgi:hypothetical protein